MWRSAYQPLKKKVIFGDYAREYSRNLSVSEQKHSQKSRIRETLNLSTNADSSTSRVDREYPKTRLFWKTEKIIETQKLKKV